jgi:hypothetical protein
MKVPFDESNRLIFAKKHSNLPESFTLWFAIGMACVSLFVVLVGIANVYANMRYEKGLADGAKKALDIHQPSQELELACAGLWIGEQNKKYNRQ